jgi:hypothetical protein
MAAQRRFHRRVAGSASASRWRRVARGGDDRARTPEVGSAHASQGLDARGGGGGGVGLFELLVTPITAPGYRGPDAIAAIGIVVSAAALLWRRSFPCSALAAVVAVLTVQWAYARGVAQLPNASFLAILIAGYSVGAHAPRVRGLLALAIAIAVFLIQDGVDLEAD